jgi:hypothetical protein
MSAQKLTLTRQLSSLVSAVAGQQRVLDDDYRQSVRDFLPVWHVLRASGLDALGRAIAPARLVATSACVDVRLFVSHDESSELRVRLATLGLQKRYARTTQAHLQLQCTLTVRPPVPDART